MHARTICYDRLESGYGELFLAGSREGLCLVTLPETAGGGAEQRLRPALEQRFGRVELKAGGKLLEAPRAWLELFLSDPGGAGSYEGRLDPGGTEFQQLVWRAMREIPAGRAATYGDLALRIGRGGAARAVGMACGANPLPLVVPCHRVVAAGYRLGGFGGGPELKRQLLAAEGWFPA